MAFAAVICGIPSIPGVPSSPNGKNATALLLVPRSIPSANDFSTVPDRLA
jgi:hypothetical protein